MQKVIIFAILGINVLAVLGGSYFTAMALQTPLLEKPAKSDLTTQEYLEHHHIFSDRPIIYSLDAFTVNLSNMEEDKKILLEVNVELNDEQSFHELKVQSAMVRDAVVSILARKEYADIATIQGKLSLKDDIAEALNKSLKKTMIRGVYFTKFFVE